MSKKSECLAWLIRRHGIEMTHLSGGSHIGSVLSAADIIAVLYADIMRYKSEDPKWDGRDRFIMSKGHAGAAVYAALAECGFFDTAELKTHYADGSRLSGHVSHHLPGVEFSTGSLGHGLSVAAGMALAAKQDGKLHRVFAVLGDGECDEGSVWEAALFDNIIICTAIKPLNPVCCVTLCGKHDHRCVADLSNSFEYLPTVHPGKHNIQQNEIRTEFFKTCNCFAAALTGEHFVSLAAKIERQYLADFLIIINNKYFFAHERSIVFHNVRHSSV